MIPFTVSTSETYITFSSACLSPFHSFFRARTPLTPYHRTVANTAATPRAQMQAASQLLTILSAPCVEEEINTHELLTQRGKRHRLRRVQEPRVASVVNATVPPRRRGANRAAEDNNNKLLQSYETVQALQPTMMVCFEAQRRLNSYNFPLLVCLKESFSQISEHCNIVRC